MTQKELIQTISEKTNVHERTVYAVMKQATETIKETVSTGRAVSLADFGIFSAKVRSARTGHNPQTGETIQIPAATLPKFSPSKKFKEMVNKRI